MKPCSNNRQLISWLALDALEPGPARELRSHLEACPACREYFDQLTQVAQKLSAAKAPTDLEPASGFHRRVVAALRTEQSSRQSFGVQLQAWFRLRPALSAASATLACLALVVVLFSQRKVNQLVSTPASRNGQTAMLLSNHSSAATAPGTVSSQSPPTHTEAAPTLACYQAIANDSLDNLDELLTRQANRRLVAAPAYTAAVLRQPQLLDSRGRM